MLPLYKARNYPKSLVHDEETRWQEFRLQKLAQGSDSKLKKYFMKIDELLTTAGIGMNGQYLLEELRLYGQSILPLIE